MEKFYCLPFLKLIFWISILYIPPNVLSDTDSYEESLWFKTLPSGHIYSHMEFVIREDKLANRNHTRLFPRVLSEIFMAHDVQELHFSLTQGYWRLESWGEPSIAAPTGALVSAWFFSKPEQADSNWNGFTSRLSGLTCASLNFLDEKTSIEPRFSYRPEGFIAPSRGKELFVRVGSLPKEHICAENLTPWTKLLPCGINRGIASLLRSKQVFNTHYHSAGIHYTQSNSEIKLKLSLSLVYDRPLDIKPTENLVRRIPGSLSLFPCQPTSKTTVKIWNNGVWKSVDHTELNKLKFSDLPEANSSEKALIFSPIKYMGGYGQEYGEMIVEMTNHLKETSLPVLYVEVLPWYIRPYLHTLRIESQSFGSKSKVPIQADETFHYTPGKDRKALHKLEMGITIPPSSTLTLQFMVEKGHLKWDEYPPDANHGFYLEAAHFEVNYTNPTTAKIEKRHYYSRILLINLSTPDFSMPYNVICLTCTVVALAFGPIHNITTKRLQLKVMVPKTEVVKRLWAKVRGKKTDEDSEIKGEICGIENESKLQVKQEDEGQSEVQNTNSS